MRAFASLVAFLALTACAANPTGPGVEPEPEPETQIPSDPVTLEGSFAAAVASSGTLGAFSVVADGDRAGGDLLGRGAVVYLDFHRGGAIRGRLLVPENDFGVDPRSVTVAGRWTVAGPEVRLETSDAWLNTARFTIGTPGLSGSLSIDGRAATLALDQVAADPSVSAGEVAEARERWEAAGPPDYRFVVRRDCFCGTTGSFVVEVEDGVTVAARRLETGEPVELLGDLPSVEGLFDLLEAALARSADRVLAEFDEDLGFPTSIDVDPDFQVSDDEVSYRILELPTDR